jgi:hypothetical protein
MKKIPIKIISGMGEGRDKGVVENLCKCHKMYPYSHKKTITTFWSKINII